MYFFFMGLYNKRTTLNMSLSETASKPSVLCYVIVGLSALSAAENMHDLWAARSQKKVTASYVKHAIGVCLSLMVTFLMFVHCCQCKSESYFWMLTTMSAAVGIALGFEEGKMFTEA